MTLITGKGVPDYELFALATPSTSIALVIPVINEGTRLHRQLRRIQKAGYDVDVIIADGGSEDGSTEVSALRELGVTTLLIKRGYGHLSAQLRMAFSHALSAGYEGVITMDGNDKDGEDGIGEITRALTAGFDFVQGSRFMAGGHHENTPPLRLFAVRVIHAPLTSLAAHKRYTDTTNGFRGHSSRFLMDDRVEVFRDVFDTYELLAYLPIQAARLGYHVCEVPVARSYPMNDEIPTRITGHGAHLRLLCILLRAASGKLSPNQAE
jgi:dolichol-phosphate mannosyltransferase